MATETPNTPAELLELQKKEKLTPEALVEGFCELSYEEGDNFIFQLLQGQLGYHKFLLEKSKKGDKNLPDTEALIQDVLRLELCVKLYQQVQ